MVEKFCGCAACAFRVNSISGLVVWPPLLAISVKVSLFRLVTGPDMRNENNEIQVILAGTGEKS